MQFFNCKITLGNKYLETCHSFEIVKTWKSIGDQAVLKLPGLAKRLETLVKTGDPVKIKAGYDGQLITEFEGYVDEILPVIPFELRLMDESYFLKRKRINKSWKSISLKALLIELGCEPAAKIPDITLAPFRLDQVSYYKALEKLKEEYGLTVYFRGKKLFAGLAYTENTAKDRVNYHLQKNVIKADLTFKRKEDVRLKINAVSVLRNNKTIKKSVGDEGGDQVTLHFYNIESESALKALAQEALEKMKYEGYRGGITTFGLPYVEHGWTANLIDELYPERNSRVFVDQVITKVSKSEGYRRVVSLGRRAS